jgi:hypothetical protein
MKWLFLVHQVRTRSSRERVKIWRLTRKVGAVLYRNSVYVLPYNKEHYEDFQWLGQQIRDAHGDASVFIAGSIEREENRRLLGLFLDSSGREYRALLDAARSCARRISAPGPRGRQVRGHWNTVLREIKHLEARLQEVRRTDFFNHPLRKECAESVKRLRAGIEHLHPRGGAGHPVPRAERKDFQRKLWATREHIHIDRLFSAWLIRKFVDPFARFAFAPEDQLPANAVVFDAPDAQFTHHGDDCTFETLMSAFRLEDPGLRALAQIVHDVDLKDGKFGRAEGPGIDLMLRGLSKAARTDKKMLRLGLPLVEALYQQFAAGG